jgi:hypothetical protein
LFSLNLIDKAVLLRVKLLVSVLGNPHQYLRNEKHIIAFQDYKWVLQNNAMLLFPFNSVNQETG